MKRRILGSILVTTAVTVVLFAVPLGFAAQRLYRSQEESKLGREATLAAAVVSTSGLNRTDSIELPTPAKPISLAVYDQTGRLVTGHGPGSAVGPVSGALAGRLTAGRSGSLLAVAVPINDEEQVI